MLQKASDQQNIISEDLRKLAERFQFHESSRCHVPPRPLLFPAVSEDPLFIVISLLGLPNHSMNIRIRSSIFDGSIDRIFAG